MSNLKDRAAARITHMRPSAPPLVPEHIRVRYAEALARIPHVRIAMRKLESTARLPSVGSFFA